MAILGSVDIPFTNSTEIANQAKEMAEQAQEQIQDVQENLANLDEYIDGAFKDGVIQESEAKAIEKYLNQLNTEKQDIDARYNSIYNDTNLTGTAKTNLASAKSSYNIAHTNLVNSINSAIADGKVTSTEKADVDAKFSAYRSALATLSQRFEEAIREIEQAKATQAENNAKTYTDQNAVKKGTLYNGVSISETDGFKVTRSDQLVQGVFNATEGIRFQTRPNTSSPWQDVLFFDVNEKKIKFAGHLEGASGTFTGTLSGGTIEGTTITGSTFYSSGFDEYGNFNELILDSGYIYYRLGGAASGDHTEIKFGESGITIDYYTGSGNHIYHNEFRIDKFLMSDEFNSKWFSVDFLGGVNIVGVDLISTNKIQAGNVYLNGANSIFNDVDNLFLNGKGGDNAGGATLDIGTDEIGPRIRSMTIYNRTYSGNANLYVTPNGVVGRITSARKYKEDIREVDLSNGYAERILNLKPKSWFDKTQIAENGGTTEGLDRVYGLIAEDVVEAGLPEYALFTPPDENGRREVDGIAYDRLWTLLIPITKNHHDRIAALEAKIQELEAKLS